jgi:hypothetical protein
MGANKKRMCAGNRKRRWALQQAERATPLWMMHEGTQILPVQAENKSRPAYHNSMCPAGLAVEHPAAAILMEWALFGCPTMTGKPWTQVDINKAIKQRPHQLALPPEAIQHFCKGNQRENEDKPGTGNQVGYHQRQPPTGTKNNTHCGNPTQVKSISVQTGSVILTQAP